ncbi:MAG: 2-isopropylmalate synthase [Acidobacteria bacterium]|nr:2-isopropylmalate synthase [Acidobacteriota bacterium]
MSHSNGDAFRSEIPESDLIHDWNRFGVGEMQPIRPRLELDDETLRDGLQSPSVRSPELPDKLRILHYIDGFGIETADVGLPGAGPHVVKDVTRIVQEIVDQKLSVKPSCAARTMQRDIEPIVEISQRTGIPIRVDCFLGSSPIRQYAEAWDMDRLLKLTHDAVEYSVKNGLPVMYVTEDTTRSKPEDLRRLFTAAVEAGAKRVCVADTVGHSTPNGARSVVRFIREVVDATGEDVKVDWHGHNDRGLGVINSLAAAEAGADGLHGTALGIGERVGNTPIDLLLVNMQLMGWIDRDLSHLPDYCELVSRTTGVELPENYPVLGLNAFRTGTGVHASAILKARAKGDEWLADRVYSAVPAEMVGRRQLVEVGPMSGESNVACWLADRGIEADGDLVQAIFEKAKGSPQVLAEEEILALCRQHGAQVKEPAQAHRPV